MTAMACGAHIVEPSNRVDPGRHTTGFRRRHGAHHPNAATGGGPTGCVTPGSFPTRDDRRMPWSNTSRRSDRYGREHRAERARHMDALRAAGAGLCAERVCIKRSRLIRPDDDLHLCHDARTGAVLGLGHRDCNVREAAVRARRKQQRRSRRQSGLKW